MIKRLIGVATVLLALVLAPAAGAQTAGSFTGKWEGTFKMQRSDGTEGRSETRRVRPEAEGEGADRHRGAARPAVEGRKSVSVGICA